MAPKLIIKDVAPVDWGLAIRAARWLLDRPDPGRYHRHYGEGQGDQLMPRHAKPQQVQHHGAAMLTEREMVVYLMRTIRLAVAGGMPADEALAAVIAVAGAMVGEVRDPVRRSQWEEHVLRTFPLAVSCASHKHQHGSMMQ